MIIVSGIVRLAQPVPADMHADMLAVLTATRTEAGCLTYSYAVDVLEPDLIRIYEEWETREALDAHSNAPHMPAWRQALARVGVAERKLVTIEAGAIAPLS
ncbi:antibiotic biosynthesis monooxygenase [Aureimonas fodinaquatilis]|uniref:Antibiotic biosynthesis monooxygenase n=1 Tax=Aureimonas fodinaquatilis TaxID=2565783 RepID=A0A5B0DVY3_9HYPH|nr:putative quinol monooxygenase [Aureimonas fodinaquatilis]KAA0969730.1 antibiotic biosynthesis monooxygenase [Aureimonas fodinaquatilis]